METITGLLKRAAGNFPDRPALSVAGGSLRLTHARLDALVDAAARDLLASPAFLPGRAVALTFPNTPELVVMFLAVIRARGVAAPMNPAYTEEEFEFYLSDSESALLLTSINGNPAAEAAALRLGIPVATVTLPDSESPIEISLPSGAVPAPEDPANDASDVALFLHTSGTTSRPKGVPLTQRNLAASVTNITSVYRLSEADSTVIVLPLFHVHGLVAALLASLASAAAIALPSSGRFSASSFWDDMRAAAATWYTAVPTVHQILLDRHRASPLPSYPRLRFIRSCSAALAPAVHARMEAAFGAPVLEAYAMTEAAHLMCSNPLPEDGLRRAGSVGRAVGQEIAILDAAGDTLPPHAAGEVCVRGPNVTSGYRNNPSANAAAFINGWFRTGDVGFLDDDGYLRLVARIKELINRGGEKISPNEVDAVLLAHPAVAEAVAFGVPDDKYGEEINCAVVAREGAGIDEAEVVRHCSKNLAAFKVPKKVYVADALPRTATGKIQRRVVADHFAGPVKATA